MSVPTKTPADTAYKALAARHNELLHEAGAFLARALPQSGNPKARTSRVIAEQFAADANEVAAEMKAWRLAHGYDA